MGLYMGTSLYLYMYITFLLNLSYTPGYGSVYGYESVLVHVYHIPDQFIIYTWVWVCTHVYMGMSLYMYISYMGMSLYITHTMYLINSSASNPTTCLSSRYMLASRTSAVWSL